MGDAFELERELYLMDIQRDHLRARLADAVLAKDAPKDRVAKRAARRAKEMERFGSYVRPGMWDADLDEYQEPQYEEQVGDGYSESVGRALDAAAGGGYSIRLVRARDLTWNAYVVLPAGHCAAGKEYDFFGGYNSPAGLPLPPQNLTYNAVEDGRGVFGFYLSNTVKPRDLEGRYTRDNFYSVERTGYSIFADDGSVYVGYSKMRGYCLELVEYFKGLAADPASAAICRDAAYCAECHRYTVGACPCSKAASKRTWAAVAAGKA